MKRILLLLALCLPAWPQCTKWLNTWIGGKSITYCAHWGNAGVVASTSAAVAFSSAILDGTCASNTFAWTGVTTSDTLVAGWPGALNAGLIGDMFVSAADTVSIRLCNISGASITPGTLTYGAALTSTGLSGSAAIDFDVIVDGDCAVNTLALTGAAAGDPVNPKWPSTLEAGLVGQMRASATDTVEIRLCNFSGASVDPASQTFGASIAK